jgi:hypothetical protein
VLDCAALDETLRWAATIPAARFGAVEIRPVMMTQRLSELLAPSAKG